MNRVEHRYINRASGNVVREQLVADALMARCIRQRWRMHRG